MVNLIHGGDIYSFENKEIIDFSANINPFGTPQKVKDALVSNIESIEHYPDPLCRKLSKKIADSENLKSEQVICGNGAADIIFRLALAIKPKKALVLAPTFAEYEIAVKTVDCKVSHYYISEEDDFLLDSRILDEVARNLYDIIFICNPNNPTGRLANRELLLEILNICSRQGTFVIVDECFMDFCEMANAFTLKPYINQFSNLLILKAFTKIYALPGLRLGYALSSNLMLLEELRNVAQPWAVSQIAQIAGIYALDEKKYVEKAVDQVDLEKHFLVPKLNELGIKTYPSAPNYVLFNIKDSKRFHSRDFKEKLAERGILIRSCANYEGLDENYFRIAIRNRAENLKLLDALSDMF